MYQWSGEDLMFRDALRSFIDKEIKSHDRRVPLQYY